MAGRQLATAVPEVVTTPTWRLVARAIPNARKDAERSSMRVCTRMSLRASNAKDSGEFREPGQMTTSVR